MRRLGKGAAVIMSMVMVASGMTFVHHTTGAKESSVVRYEAENAEIFVKGSAADDYKIEESENYSGGKAVGNMNTWPDDGRSYCETKVYVKAAGTYSMTIGYGGGEENHPCNIDVRINEGEWQSALAYPTAGWDTVGTTTLNIELQAGENVIDVTGACNIWYEGMGWEWINLDYFELAKIADESEIPTDETTAAQKDETTSVKPEEKTTAQKATKAAVKAPGRATIKKVQNVKGKKAKFL